MSHLVFGDQRHLHDYYVPTKDLTDDEVLAHRRTISHAHPSLPHGAGRAYSAFDQVAARRAPQPMPRRVAGQKRAHHGRGQVVIRALVQPEIDVRKLSRLLLAMATDAKPTEGDDHPHNNLGTSSR
jgi:hypothetical protein